MEGLHPAAEQLRDAGHLLDARDRSPSSLDERRRAAARDQLDAQLVQAAGELLQAGLVEDGDEGAEDHGQRERKSLGDELRAAARQQPVLDRVEAREQRLGRVARLDRDRLLSDDRPGVDALVDEVHGDARLARRPPRAPPRPRACPGRPGSSEGWTLMTVGSGRGRPA